MSQALINRILGNREVWFEIEPGKSVKLRRPAETEMPAFRAGITSEQLAKIVVDWKGITEADLLGAAVGSDTVVPFSADVWTVVVADRTEWFAAVTKKVLEMVLDHLQAKGLIAKN